MGDFIRQYDDVHVSVAVQTPHGLMVPVTRNTDRMALSDINAEVKVLASKVKRPPPPPCPHTHSLTLHIRAAEGGLFDFIA